MGGWNAAARPSDAGPRGWFGLIFLIAFSAWSPIAEAGLKTSGGTFDAIPLPIPLLDTSRQPTAPVATSSRQPAAAAPAATPVLTPPPTRPPATSPAPAPATRTAAPAPRPAPPVAQAQPVPSSDFEPNPLLGFILELRGGVLAHAFGPTVIDSRRESGLDINLEMVFVSPPLKFFWYLFEPRPTLDIDINTNGQTTFGYGGFTWERNITRNLYADFFLGLAGHDGFLNNAPRDRRELGSRLLFREALELGWRWREQHAISLMIDHYSNAGYFAKKNQGNDNFGIRYSYRY